MDSFDFFTPDDHARAVAAMLAHVDPADRALLGTLSGIKRRARTRAVIAFMQRLDPPPPDATITTTRALLRVLFSGRAISNNELQRHFATPGRKADDRADAAALRAWLEAHRERLTAAAEQRLRELDQVWRRFTQAAATEAGALRRRENGQ
ncbi:hypothetical protein [Paraburkholderia sp. J63]|uniref:hypothetical protein n=1 Tax=Paraburkholderia sp. J63 TaxID=2805434 RepID=UPI002ABE9068|nr:hypothetical protein [Paraburkholderia sp. J63]